MDLPDRHPRSDRSPAIAELLESAFVVEVDVDTASRHLWAIHTEAARLAAERDGMAEDGSADQRAADQQAVTPGRDLVGAAAGGGRRGIPRAAMPLLVLVLMMSSSGVALAASQSSLPGDVLYPVKRGTEQVQLIFARTPEARAQLQLSFVRTRMEEIRRIAATRPQHVPALVAAINVTLEEAREAAPEDSERFREVIDAEIAALDIPAAPAAGPVAGQDVAAAATQDTTTTPVPSASAPDQAGTPTATPTAPATPQDAGTPTAAPTTAPPTAPPTTAPPTGEVATPDGQPTPRPSTGTGSGPTTPAAPSPVTTPTPTPTPSPSEGGGTDDRSGEDDDGYDPQPSPTPTTPSTEPGWGEPSEPFRPYTRPGELPTDPAVASDEAQPEG